MQDVAKIVLAVESEALAQDVIDFLDRSTGARVVDTVRDPDAVAEVVERERPDAVIGSPFLIPEGALNGSPLLAVDTEETVRVLRRAVDAGARGFFVWPSDRAALATAASDASSAAPAGVTRSARIVAVYGPRGGVGTTFVATHLAAALASLQKQTFLVDADLAFGEVAWALGVPPDAGARTLADLAPLGDEISEDHIRDVSWPHASGLRALLAPAGGAEFGGKHVGGVVSAAARSSDAVVVHLPRSLDVLRSELVLTASALLVVVSLDVSAFRAAKRAIESLDPSVSWEIVVNRARRGLITVGDVERVFGKPPICVLPRDRSVVVAQDRGELVPSRTRLGRAVRRLASTLLEEAA
ncbi:MAG: CpaE family protein [Actinomycetota bacterium]